MTDKETIWEELIDYACSLGHDRDQVTWGSMPKETLLKLSNILSGHGLQVGGFVGIAHCFLAFTLKDNGSISTIDPNIPHRDIENPFNVMSKMVTHFNFSKNSMLINGYAKEQIKIFQSLNVKFDFIILDGNHDYEILIDEISISDLILKSGGYIVLDDIDHWDGPRKAYNSPPIGYKKIVLDSRAGVLQKILEG